MEDLCQEVELGEEESSGQISGQMMRNEWGRIRGQYQNARSSSRSALLQGRRTLQERKKNGRLNSRPEEDRDPSTTSSLAPPNKSIRQKVQDRSTTTPTTGDEAALLASQDLTTALESALYLLSDNLTQSAYSSQLLEESSTTLSTLSFDYATFNTLLQNSSGILKSMERQDKIDALMLLGAYLFFGLCVGYILKVRIWDRGVGVVMILLKVVGLGRGKGKEMLKEKGVKDAIGQAGKVGKGVVESATKQVGPAAAAVTTTLANLVASRAAAEAARSAVAGLRGSQRQPEEIHIEIASPDQVDEAAKQPKALDEQVEEEVLFAAEDVDHDGLNGQEDNDDDLDGNDDDIGEDEVTLQTQEEEATTGQGDPRRHIEL